jgi:Fe-S-cluster containining protein
MIRAFKDLHDLHVVLDAGERLLEETIGVSTCVSNCGKCCEQNTTQCMAIEALNMVSALLTVEQSVDLAEGWLLENQGIKIFRGVPTGVIPPDMHQEWAKLTKTQCPFLKDDKSCQIYSQRPITCRTFGVYRDNFGIDCPRAIGKGETLTRHAVVDSSMVIPLHRTFTRNCELKNPQWVIHGFVPSLLFRAAKPDKFRAYIADNKIASAKLIGMNMNIDLLWQNQVDDLRRGVSPMEVVKREYTAASKIN